MLPTLTPTFIIAVLIAVAVHEWAHAFAAYRLGDPTAKYDGRLTLNPIAHLDPIGTVLFLLVGFGWGKPVPVDPRYFKKPVRDGAMVAFAGPLSNIVLAFIAFAIAYPLGIAEEVIAGNYGAHSSVVTEFLSQLLSDMVIINLVLMAFNLLPIPPLDGSKIVRIFLPYEFEHQYAQFSYYGPWILLALIVAGRAFGFPVLSVWIELIITPFLSLMNAMV